MEKRNKNQSTKKHVKSLHQQFIVFQNPSELNSAHNPEITNQQIHNKTNHKLKNSFFNNKIINPNTYHLITDPKFSTDCTQTLQKQQRQIFGVPNSIINLSKLSPLKKTFNESLSHRKLFPQEEEFLKELKEKTKIKSSRNSTNTFNNDNSNNNFQNLQKLHSKKLNEQEHILINGQQNPQKPNRSRTLDVQNTSEPFKESHNPKERSRNYFFFKKCFQKQHSQNVNKFYEKFESFCLQTQRQRIVSFNEQKPIYKDSFKEQKKNMNAKKQFFRQKMDNRMIKLRQRRFEQNSKGKEHEKESEPSKLPDTNSSKKDSKKDRIVNQGENKIKILVKSNSNNKIFNDTYLKRSTANKTEISHEINNQQKLNNDLNQIIKGTFDENERKLFFSWKGERIHQIGKQKQKQTTSYLLLKSERKKNKRNNKYFSHQRTLKMSNDMHIVMTQNHKTKINTFHNSFLLKEDPQKVDTLTYLVRQSLDNGKPQKISIPYELEINKLNIAEKNNQSSNQRFDEIVKNVKTTKRSPIQNLKTQRKYQLRIEDARPWEIRDQRNILESKQLFNLSLDDSESQD